MLKSGVCLLIETNPNRVGEIQKHLYVIVLEPQGETKLTIIVHIETLRSSKQDHTTILKPGDHAFIKNPSYVVYRRAEIISIDELESKLKNKTAKEYLPFSKDVFNRICDGILKSRFTKYAVRDLYQDPQFHAMKCEE